MSDAMAWLRQTAAAAPTPARPPARRVEPTAGPMAWADKAACAGMDAAVFYPVETEPWDRTITAPARAVCSTCPVFTDCHDHALRNESEGIWASTTPTGRRKTRRALGIVDPATLGRDNAADELVGLTPPSPNSTPAVAPPKSPPSPA